ncbi:MAG TPA: hypothetical protein VHR97_01685 [Candidatus Baltobacteraceae bacterium]|jgi:hypothetical protein|nr:hypothetical protein [Candidatus Baltobacteraceae bacterium]
MEINDILANLAASAGDRSEIQERTRSVAIVNRQQFAEMADRWVAGWAAKFKKKFGYDGLAELKKPGFNLGRVASQCRARGLSEEVTTSQVYALATGLITQNMTDIYKTVPTTYRDLAKIRSSTKAEETYFPLQGADVPVPLEDNEAAPSSGMGGVLTRIKNWRFARIFEHSATLEEDDQTGSIRDLAQMNGKKMPYAEERWWLQQLIAVYVAGNVRTAGGTGIVPAACIAGSSGLDPKYGGPPTQAGPVDRDKLATLYTAADYITDIEGDLTLFEIDSGLFASADKITVKTIMTSDFNPNTPPGTPNTVNGIFAKNPIQDLFVIKFTRFMKYFTGSQTLTGAGQPWFLGEAGSMGDFQERTPLTVTMENPDSGRSWEANMRRSQAQRRFGAGVTIPEATMRGN